MDRVGSGQRVLVLAGEASGDHHAARVVEAMLARRPSLEFVGLGGPDLAQAGVTLIEGLDRLAVMGFVEVVKHLRFFWGLSRRIKGMLERGEVDLVLAVDYPGFNLRMTRAAREAGVPVLYYIAPQVWAWKARRAAELARDASHIAVILPFEPPIFEREGGAVSFVGHPLVEAPEPTAHAQAVLREELGIAAETPVLALLPGSREQELHRHLELFVDAAARLREDFPELQPVLAVAPGVDPARLSSAGLPVTAETRTLLRTARVALVKSGTSTLEAAVAGVPFVMAYRTSPMTWTLAKRLVKVPHIALANLVAGRRVVPELLQHDATPASLARAVAPLIPEESPERKEMLAGLAETRAALGDAGAADRVAEQALALLDQEGAP